MTPPEFLALVLAGVGGGLTGSIAGLASLVTYPVLLAFGLSPITANVTNTVALVFNSVGSVSGSRRELTGARVTLVRLLPVVVAGGAAGGALLLSTSSGAFSAVVPVLIALASVAVVLPRRRVDPSRTVRPPERVPIVVGSVFAIAVYGGYFGAAAGVLMLALFLSVVGLPLPNANALKNVLLGAANTVAALIFIVVGHVDWAAMVPLALGLLVGGRIGPAVVRRAPARAIRLVIGAAGVGLAIYLAVDR